VILTPVPSYKDIYGIFYPTTTEYTFFLVVHGTFSKIDHILGYKANLNKYKKTEITSCILSDLREIKLEIHNERNYRKYSNTWALNHSLLMDQQVIEEIKEVIKNS
jgi:hypothetical protein